MAVSTGTRHALREALIWSALAAGAIALFLHFNDVKSALQTVLGLPKAPIQSAAQQANSPGQLQSTINTQSSGNSIELHAGAYGQFRTHVEINGTETPVLIDTGASAVALTDEDARSAGIFPDPEDYTIRIQTANGVGHAAPVTLDSITIGDITVNNVRALVNQPGTLNVTLLGMTFLNRLSRVDIGAGKMVLEQ